jgi:hypothetical protein
MKNHNQTRQMIKDMIQENAVAFKESTSKNLYFKVQNKLEEQYKKVSKNIFKNNTNETNN